MPITYAHYRFGAEMLCRMPADVRGTVKRFRQLYDVGLHGPDLLLFYGPVRRLGRKFHMQTGGEFFSRVCRELRQMPGEGGQAYLYGVLCHFVLDVRCRSLTDPDPEAERAFDRFLMEQDGVCLPLWTHMGLTGSECALVSRFYPGTDKTRIRRSLRTMALGQRVLEMPPGPARTTLARVLGRSRELWPPEERSCRNQLLLERYLQAAEAFPEMLLGLIAHLTYNAPLGESFDPVFGSCRTG